MISVEGASGSVSMAIADGDTAPLSGPNEGRFRYNLTLQQVELSQNTSPYAPIGGSGPTPVPPYTCPSIVAVRDAVYLSGADTVDQAEADVVSERPLVGFVVSKPTPTSAVVQYTGEVSGFTGLIAGATYWLSETPGQITPTSPTTQGSIVQEVGWARNSTTLVINIQNDFVLL